MLRFQFDKPSADRLNSLPSAVVGVPIPKPYQDPSTSGGFANVTTSPTTGHNSQIDVNLTIANISRVAIATFGVTSAFAAVTTTEGVRYRLQCALAAAACLVTSGFYVKFTTIRRAKGVAYSRAGNAAVDSLRYSCWSVTNGTLAWLGMLLRGPFPESDPLFYELDYNEWVRLASVLASLSVICSGSALFCAETARYSRSRCAFIGWGVTGAFFLAAAVAGAAIVSLALHREADHGDNRQRPDLEIVLGRSLGVLWIVYPLINVLKVVVTFISTHNAEEVLGARFGQAVVPVARMGEGIRDALVWSLRVMSSSHAYSPLPSEAAEHARDHMGYSLLPPVYTQMFDALLAISDFVSIGFPALACTAFALPVSS